MRKAQRRARPAAHACRPTTPVPRTTTGAIEQVHFWASNTVGRLTASSWMHHDAVAPVRCCASDDALRVSTIFVPFVAAQAWAGLSDLLDNLIRPYVQAIIHHRMMRWSAALHRRLNSCAARHFGQSDVRIYSTLE